MHITMKHINKNIIIGATLSCLPFTLNAATNADGKDSIDNPKDQMVQVAFQKVKKSELLGGVSVLDYKELTKKNYNTYSLDNLQGYIDGWNGSTMWGLDGYLVLVDGVPRDANNILPTEIDQVTFLKGAQAVVLYGSRATKGAILITTKKGNIGDLKISARGNVGIFAAKSYPKYLGSAQYMSLYNEARANDGLTPLYTDNDIYNYSSGENPYRYPNLDFYSSDYINKCYTRSEANMEINGGSKIARFYANINYYHLDDVFNFGEAKNNGTDRLSIRGNIDLNLNDYISAYIHSNVSFYDVSTANSSSNYWSTAATFRPNRLSPLIPTSSIDPNSAASWIYMNNSLNIVNGNFLSGTTIDQTNVIADMCAGGHGKYTSRQFQFDAGLKFDLAKVLKGLSFETQFAIDYATAYTTAYNNTYAVYTPNWSNYNGSDVISSLTKINNDKKSGTQNVSGSSDNQTIMFSSQFNYNTTINKVHNIKAMLIGAGYQTKLSGTYHKTSNVNLGLELDYNYAGKYFAQIGTALVHSAKLAPGHRDALSPSATLGWKLKNENFLKNSSIVDELTLSASLSELNSDTDIQNYYLYEANYTQADGAYWSWADGTLEKSTNVKRGENPDLRFIKRKEFSVSMQTSLLNHLIEAKASFFTNVIDGGLIQPSTIYPSYFSTYYPSASFIPYVNYNKDKRTGFDFGVNLNKKVGQVGLSLGVTGMYYTSKATQRDENYADSYQNRTGKPLDGLWGLVSDGFYSDAADVAKSPKSSYGTCKPGDIKYVDQNGDGIINAQDQVYLGKGGWYGSPFTLGINLTAKYKDFTFFALCTGNYGAKAFKNNSYWWVYGDGKYSEAVLGRWTEATASTATYPRLTTGTSDNNFQNSTFWLYSTDRFDLAKVQITYDLPKKWFENFFISGVSAYVSGSNLLTFSGERKILEMNVGSAPQYRFYNLGVNVTF
ncbi:TonB-linked outer membrane protein, SusC/RagA family [Xylanibacter oryzae DSM 17970]|uniref:TonB-linked outer membrane protein, SusC/RagA family n=2 Tax=Xylanibacter oryzae TaxID=185293 RepID=A0ABN0RU58_9BACT|nr:TonB-linked outer membrane protein, SusC/RagA family [Xylanibacter oryzae DSM 17970]